MSHPVKRIKQDIHGWLILDKPLGITSAHAVARVKRILSPMKIGHAGTLDPLASGILPLALGEATKTVQYAMDGRKTYRFTVTWGEARSTDDAEGQVVATSDVRPTEAAIRDVLPRFTGVISQVPPIYSAIKVDGERAYDLARAGEDVQLSARDIEVFTLGLLRAEEGFAEFEADCGKGTYIRSLGRDMALALGTCGYITALRRTRVGKFTENQAISLEKLEDMVHKGAPEVFLHSVATPLDDIPAFKVDAGIASRLRHGQAVPLATMMVEGSVVRLLHDDKTFAIGRVESGLVKPVRVFNY